MGLWGVFTRLGAPGPLVNTSEGMTPCESMTEMRLSTEGSRRKFSRCGEPQADSSLESEETRSMWQIDLSPRLGRGHSAWEA